MKRFLIGTGILIAVYLVVANATGAGSVIQAAGGAYTGAVKTLQGRA